MNKTKLLKSFIFLLIPTFLLVVTFLVIIITQGGRVTDQGIVNDLGTVRIFTDPSDINFQVYIDEQPVSLINNKSLNLVAGEHKIRIEAENYITWGKNIIVTQGIVNEIYAKLFSANLSLTKLTSVNVANMYFSPNSEFLFYIVNDSQFPQDLGIWRLQLRDNNFNIFNQLQEPIKFFDITDIRIKEILTHQYDIYPSNDGNMLLIKDLQTSKAFVLSSRQNFNSVSTNIIDLYDQIGFIPSSIKWMNNFNSLLLLEDNSIYEYNISSNIITLIKLTKDMPLIYVTNESQVFLYDTIKKTLLSYKDQILSPQPLENIFPENLNALYLASKNDRFIFIQTATSWILYDLEQNVFMQINSNDDTLISIAPDGSSLLFLTKDKKIVSKNIVENIVENKLIINTNFFDINYDNVGSLKYVPQSFNLLLYNKEDGCIYAYDKDGTNKIKLLEGLNNVDSFDLDNTGSNLYIKLVDESTLQNTTTSNIYKIPINK